MNNSHITIEQLESKDISELLRSEEARLVRIIEAIQKVQVIREWRTLKEEIFDGLVSTLEKDLRSEARSEKLDPQKLSRLSGKLEWAERYSDLSKLENYYRIQLKSVKIKLYGQKE